MLNKSFIIQHDGQGHLVRFKYISPDDFKSYYEAYIDEYQGRVLGAEEFYEKHKQSTMMVAYNKLTAHPDWVTDLGLQQNETILEKLYYAFLRSRDAAHLSSVAFQWLRPDRGRSFKLNNPFIGTPIGLIRDILREHFKGARSAAHLMQIHRTFAQTARGLKLNCTISDNAGRETINEVPVEGIVNAKRHAYNRSRREWHAMPERHMYGDDPRKKRAIQDQKRKVLATETDNKSIHIQFSTARVKPVDWLARYILHEATHKFGATCDWAYLHHRNGFDHIRPAAAVVNADSFAFAGMSILRREITTPQDLNSVFGTPFNIQNRAYFAQREHYEEFLKYGGD